MQGKIYNNNNKSFGKVLLAETGTSWWTDRRKQMTGQSIPCIAITFPETRRDALYWRWEQWGPETLSNLLKATEPRSKSESNEWEDWMGNIESHGLDECEGRKTTQNHHFKCDNCPSEPCRPLPVRLNFLGGDQYEWNKPNHTFNQESRGRWYSK